RHRDKVGAPVGDRRAAIEVVQSKLAWVPKPGWSDVAAQLVGAGDEDPHRSCVQEDVGWIDLVETEGAGVKMHEGVGELDADKAALSERKRRAGPWRGDDLV